MMASSSSAKASRPCCPSARRRLSLPVWAALSSGHLGAVLLPEGLRCLYIAIDRDPAGQRAAERLTARATEVGIAVRVLEPQLGDFNDDLRAHGIEALRQHLAADRPQGSASAVGLSNVSAKAVREAGAGVKHRLRNRVASSPLPLPGCRTHPTPARPSRDGQAAVKGAAPSRTGGN